MTFLDIFSSKPVKPKIKPKIIVDHREKSSLLFPKLQKHFQLQYKQLPVADYLINNIAIERKTLSDLKSSIKNKRIISQLLELKQYPQHLLLIEGFPSESNSRGLHPNALRGFILSVATEFQVPIIFTQDASDTLNYLLVLSKKTPKTSPIRASKIFRSEKQQIQHILEGFPNIGPQTIRALLKKFKSLHNIFNASHSELEPILKSRTSAFLELINKRITQA